MKYVKLKSVLMFIRMIYCGIEELGKMFEQIVSELGVVELLINDWFVCGRLLLFRSYMVVVNLIGLEVILLIGQSC